MRKTLIEKRREANLTQTQIAEAVGIPVTMYSRIESGKRTPSFRNSIKNSTFTQCKCRRTVF